MSDALVEEYQTKIEPLLPLAKRAYGSRTTDSPNHTASREYTRLLCEFYDRGGSLLKLSKALGVAYAGLRRRVTTVDVLPVPKKRDSKLTEEDYDWIVDDILRARGVGTEEYHESLHYYYTEEGVSLSKVAKRLGCSSANPLYYGVQRVELKRRQEGQA